MNNLENLYHILDKKYNCDLIKNRLYINNYIISNTNERYKLMLDIRNDESYYCDNCALIADDLTINEVYKILKIFLKNRS